MASWQEEYKMVVAKGFSALVVLAVAAWVFLLPVLEQSTTLHGEIHRIEDELKRQSIFLPEYLRLKTMLERDKAEEFILPAFVPVSIQEIEILPSKLVRLALDTGLEVLDTVVSPSSLRTGSGRMMMQCVVFGDMPRFQDFFHELSALPYVSEVDKVEMRAVPGGIEFFVEFWVLLDEGRG